MAIAANLSELKNSDRMNKIYKMAVAAVFKGACCLAVRWV